MSEKPVFVPEHLQPCGLTHEQLGQACENVGVDLTCGACSAQFFTGYTGPTDRHDAIIEHHPKCKSTFHKWSELARTGYAFLRLRSGHAGACCTCEDSTGRTIVTRKSCKCDAVTKAFRDALDAWEPREWELPKDGVYVGPSPTRSEGCTESMPCQGMYVCPRHR